MSDVLAAILKRDFADPEELRASFKLNGWLPELPAIKDEHGHILVGNRRTAIAQELGIEPVIMTVVFGDDEAAAKKREALALASNLGNVPMTPEHRKRVAEQLYLQRNMTEQQIADYLKVSQSTIRDALKGLVVTTKPARPKGGRPKGAGRSVDKTLSPSALKPKPQPRSDREREQEERNACIIRLADDGWTVAAIACEIGLGERMINRVLEIEKARRSSAVEAALPKSEKMKAMIEREMRRLSGDYRAQVAIGVRRGIEAILPSYNASCAEHQAIIKSRKGVMDKAEYNQFLFCLHPDRVANLNDATLSNRFGTAFDSFQKLRRVLLSEKEDPTYFPPLPTSYEELMKARQAVMAKRRAQRETSKSALKPR